MTTTAEKLSECIDEIKVWMNMNYLKINVNKTQVMCVANKRLLQLFETRMVDMLQSKVGIEHSQIYDHVKLLGVELDQELTMRKRIMDIYRSGMFKIKVLSGLRNVIDSDTKIILAKALILTTLDYCNILLALAPNYLISKLQEVQNASVRFINNMNM